MSKQKKMLLIGAGVAVVAYLVLSTMRKAEEKRRKENPTTQERLDDGMADLTRAAMFGPFGVLYNTINKI